MTDNPNIREHKFSSKCGEELIHFYVAVFSGSTYIWVGRDCRLSALSLGLPITGESKSTQIFGESFEGSVQYMTERLSKKLNRQVLMSYTLSQEQAFGVEKILAEKIQNELELFT
ncbi:DgyrCDS12225 [Dimorphilus gyrociliatus]|uniref:DgyrCDS12225 n=1 Tax=Dimorphilus gyrociliatus TaxID=2664684 RepID=A0A7I8W5T8_9ANNE|nr:DgyrCDS12225 [Dimorphilus gyrociliatus]